MNTHIENTNINDFKARVENYLGRALTSADVAVVSNTEKADHVKGFDIQVASREKFLDIVHNLGIDLNDAIVVSAEHLDGTPVQARKNKIK